MRQRFQITALALAAGLALSHPRADAGPVPWPDAAYSYYAESKPLSAVLTEFATGFSLSLSIPPGMDTPVSGRFNLRNPTAFIDRLAGVYGFTWFTHGGTLFVSSNKDVVSRSMSTAIPGMGGSLRQVLTDLKILDSRFGWGELPEQGVVVVSGPPAYVQLVESTVASLPRTPGGLQVAVFRLKHASVDDRSISYRDREITTPGVATVLRNLVSGSGANVATRLGPVANLAAALSPYSATSPTPSEAGKAATPASPTPNGPTATVSGNSARVRPSIQSDPRINAIIIQDTPDRIPIYQQLIAALDVATPLIEIEAMIIDVNTSRLQELGISWNAVTRGGGTALGFGNVDQAADKTTISAFIGSAGAGANPSTVLSNASTYFISRLRLLEQQGDASIQARPSILTTENVGAVIDLSETAYIQTTSERTALVTPITAGTTLRVTPRLTNPTDDSAVRLYVDIEDGQIQSAATSGGLPTIRRGVVSTEASVRKDESLLIGGYNSVQTVKGKDKIPILGDIPYLGALFSNASDQIQRRERLFLVRAKIVGNWTFAQNAAEVPKDLLASSLSPLPVSSAQMATTGAVASAQTSAASASAPLPQPLPTAHPAAAKLSSASAMAAETKAVDAKTQAVRNAEARRVLEKELQRAESKLKQLKAKASRTAEDKDKAETSDMKRAVSRAQADVNALRREIARVSGGPANSGSTSSPR